MNTEFFVKQIAMNKDKENYLREKLTAAYIPYEDKVASCENIIRNTSFIKDEASGETFYKRNSPACTLFFNLTLIDKYYDIDIDFNNTLADYNRLQEKGYIDLLLKNIPEGEYIEWQNILNMVAGDFMENERSLVSFLETRFGAMNKSLASIAEIIKQIPTEENQGE